MVPFSFDTNFWSETPFWVGLLFVTFPLNYLVYGLNDYNDIKADAVNARKGNFLFGAKSTGAQLKKLPQKIAWATLPFAVYFVWIGGWKMLVLLAFMVAVNVVYNFKPFRVKERPPFEIFIQVGYVFTALFSICLNGADMLPWQSVLYLTLFAFQAHIAGEIMDIEADLLAGKQTTATRIGRKKTKLLMLVLLVVESLILFFGFRDYVLGTFLAVFSLWLALDTFVFFKGRPYSLQQMKWFGYAMNISAFASMLWILYSGTLLHPLF